MTVQTFYINWEPLELLLRDKIDLPSEPLRWEKFSEGYSNMTYLLKVGDWEGVMRRPPGGPLPPRAHDMEREFTLLEKINPLFHYAPKPYLLHEDEAIMDKHFYVMEKKEGVVVDETFPERWGSSETVGPKLSRNLIGTLIELQQVDYKKAGLEKMGKPEGFMARQVNGWIKRYDAAKTEDIQGIGELEDWLKQAVPLNPETTIVHNDFKLNNIVIDADDPSKTTGVLDWELATIGDPLSDVGSALAYWGSARDRDMGINAVSSLPGFYSRREFTEEYAKKSGRDMTHIDFYLAFGFYKLAVILQQIYKRWADGTVEDERFGTLNGAVRNLIEMGHDAKAGKLL